MMDSPSVAMRSRLQRATPARSKGLPVVAKQGPWWRFSERFETHTISPKSASKGCKCVVVPHQETIKIPLRATHVLSVSSQLDRGCPRPLLECYSHSINHAPAPCPRIQVRASHAWHEKPGGLKNPGTSEMPACFATQMIRDKSRMAIESRSASLSLLRCRAHLKPAAIS